MSRVVELLCSRRLPHVAALALMSIGFAGCSADMQSRFATDGGTQPSQFGWQRETTGSVPPPQVERHELPQYSRPQPQVQSSAMPPPIAAPQSYPTASTGVSGGGRGLSSYAPPAHPPLDTTGTVAPRSVAAKPAPAQAGTTIIVGTSDTLETLSRRYNVSSAAILQANGYKGPRALSPGQQLIIPRQTAAVAAPAVAAPALTAPASKVVAAPAAPAVHVVNRGDTLLSIARRSHVPVAQLAKANGLDASAKLKLGQKVTVPGSKTAAAAPLAQPAAVAAGSVAPATKLAAVTGVPPQSARLAQATTKVEETPAAETPAKANEATGALPTFRWPVRGKVITSYGAKTNGKSNDGINLAVPEGTPVNSRVMAIWFWFGTPTVTSPHMPMRVNCW
jgi:LysM repeat protein